MIVVAILFGCILWFECNYMHRKQRKTRTFVIVIVTGIFFCMLLEALSYFRGQWAFAQIIEIVFNPVEQFIWIGS